MSLSLVARRAFGLTPGHLSERVPTVHTDNEAVAGAAGQRAQRWARSDDEAVACPTGRRAVTRGSDGLSPS